MREHRGVWGQRPQAGMGGKSTMPSGARQLWGQAERASCEGKQSAPVRASGNSPVESGNSPVESGNSPSQDRDMWLQRVPFPECGNMR